MSETTEQEYLEDNIATVAFHLGQPGAKISVRSDKDALTVDPGEVLKEISRRLSVPAQPALTPELMNRTTVSSMGKNITISCDNHDTTNKIMDALVAVAYSVPSTVAQGATDPLDKLSDMVTAKIEQLEYYRANECQLDHAKTIADGRISQAIQILHWIAQLSSLPSTDRRRSTDLGICLDCGTNDGNDHTLGCSALPSTHGEGK